MLCISPFLVVVLVAARSLRIPGVHQVVGGASSAVLALCAWWLSRPPGGSAERVDSRVRLAGMLLLAPFALIALLWVGLATPWDATPAENEMRYAVLLAGAVSITVAFFLLHDVMRDAGERIHATLGLATAVLSGAAFVVWTSFQMGFHAMVVDRGETPAALAATNDVLDALLFAAGALAYAATAAFAHAAGRVAWLGRRAAPVYVALNLLALVFLVVRGVSFPAPSASPEPWYLRPGFIVGIPAMPWVMPFLLGVVFLRRAGRDPVSDPLRSRVTR